MNVIIDVVGGRWYCRSSDSDFICTHCVPTMYCSARQSTDVFTQFRQFAQLEAVLNTEYLRVNITKITCSMQIH